LHVNSSDAPQPAGGPPRADVPEHERESGSEDEAEPGQSEEAARLQLENAETSLDQPST